MDPVFASWRKGENALKRKEKIVTMRDWIKLWKLNTDLKDVQ